MAWRGNARADDSVNLRWKESSHIDVVESAAECGDGDMAKVAAVNFDMIAPSLTYLQFPRRNGSAKAHARWRISF